MKQLLILIAISCGLLLSVMLFSKNTDEGNDAGIFSTAKTAKANKKKVAAAIPKTTPTPRPTVDYAFLKFQTGDYETAIKLLRQRLIENKNSQLVKDNLATALYALASFKLKEQKLLDAEKLLEEATTLGNRDAAIALASLKVRLGDTNSGMTVLDEYFDKTNDPAAAIALIDLSLSKDDFAKSQFYIKKAEDLKTESPEKKEELTKQLEERKKMFERRAYFQQKELVAERGAIQVAFPSSNEAFFAEAIAANLDRAFTSFSDIFVPPPTQIRIKAVIIPSQDFQATTGAPPWAQAIFDGIIRIPVLQNQPREAAIARASILGTHEMFHAYLLEVCGSTIPVWLNEGLAMLAEKRSVEKSKLVFRMKYGHNIPAVLQSDAYFDEQFINAPNNMIEELYARSHLLVTWLGEHFETSVWRTIITQHCVQRLPLYSVLRDELGATTGMDLWKQELARHVNAVR